MGANRSPFWNKRHLLIIIPKKYNVLTLFSTCRSKFDFDTTTCDESCAISNLGEMKAVTNSTPSNLQPCYGNRIFGNIYHLAFDNTESEVQVNFCQKLLFLHQLTHNMTTDYSLNYKFNT